MKSSYQNFILGIFLMSSISLTACSSNKVGEAETAETAAELAGDTNAAEASTDAVPAAGDELSLDAAATNPAPVDAPVSPDTSNTASADVVPSAEAPVSPISDAPVSDSPVADVNPTAEAPVTDSVIASDVPAMDSSEPSVVTPEPQPVKKAKKGKKGKKSSKSNYASQSAPSGPASGYQVKAGDTLMKIAFEQYGDLYRWKEIYNANRSVIQDPNHVPPGTNLTLNGAGMVTIERNGESYLIKRGDTLGVISKDVYGTMRKWKKLWENNRQLIKDPNKIYAGFYLYYVPEGKLTREEVQPGLKSDESAMNAPVVGAAPRTPASEASTEQAVQGVPAENAPAKN
jgi:nucleoid-associated protein YgaU